MFVIAWNREKAQGKGMSVWRSSLVPACVETKKLASAQTGTEHQCCGGYRRFPLKRGRGLKVLGENRLRINGSQAEE